MFFYSSCNTPFVWRHMKSIHLYFLLTDCCLNFYISMIFCTISFKTIYIISWVISRAINYLYEFYKLFISVDFKTHFFMPTDNSLAEITNILGCPIVR